MFLSKLSSINLLKDSGNIQGVALILVAVCVFESEIIIFWKMFNFVSIFNKMKL